ncbi:MAG: signal recognition particle-docking protein FtsY, partial [Deltaproteobacteria bacterium]
VDGAAGQVTAGPDEASAPGEPGGPAEQVDTTHQPPPPSVASRFFAGLARSRAALARSLGRALADEGPLEERLEQLEEALIAADCGVRTASRLVEAIRRRAPADADADALRSLLAEELRASLGPPATIAEPPAKPPLVILVVGVNGSGKTTTIGKLAHRYIAEGKKVLLGAGDTFRAGAIEQLQVWGERAGAPVVAHQAGADPAAVTFDAIKAGEARGADVVICDTAGRLQAQKTLMDELGKVVRVMKKARPDAPHEVLLVLDATIGQNALSQARVFKEVVGVTGVALTKLDGTARGGVVVAVHEELGLPVKLVGLGEGADDLRDFDPDAFVDALLGEPGPGGPASRATRTSAG